MKVENFSMSFDNSIDVARMAAKNFDFNLFKDNFKKNNGGFPNIDDDSVMIGEILDEESKPVALIAYAYPNGLKNYRACHNDNHTRSAHIFDFEVLSNYRGKGIGKTLLNGTLNALKNKGIESVTLMAINKKMADHYNNEYGFLIYKGEENVDNPTMIKTLKR